MTPLSQSTVIGICGAGAMGAGIAQVAATAGHKVIVFDSFDGALKRGRENVEKGAAALLKRGKIDEAKAEAIMDRLSWTDEISSLSQCGLIIEAIIEDLDIKIDLFQQLESFVSETTYLATNTSSLSVSAIAAKLSRPENFLGLHFFNPAPIMKLVEVISGLQTGEHVAPDCLKLMQSWGKQAVIAKDVPGFIVNRVARPFYAEGWQAFEEGVAGAATIDFLLRDLAGFRMGPLELGDLIGHDINSKAAKSVFDLYNGRTRFRPSLLQGQLAESGLLGRKSGRGVYDYSEGAAQSDPDFETEQSSERIVKGSGTEMFSEVGNEGDFSSSIPRGFWLVDDVFVGFSNGSSATAMSRKLASPVAVLDYVHDMEKAQSLAYSAVNDASDKAARALITALGKKPVRILDRPGAIVFRTLLQLVNAAADAVRDQVGTADAIDKALLFGVNYPVGPMSWAKELGYSNVIDALNNIADETGEGDFYSPNHFLRGLS